MKEVHRGGFLLLVEFQLLCRLGFRVQDGVLLVWGEHPCWLWFVWGILWSFSFWCLQLFFAEVVLGLEVDDLFLLFSVLRHVGDPNSTSVVSGTEDKRSKIIHTQNIFIEFLDFPLG